MFDARSTRAHAHAHVSGTRPVSEFPIRRQARCMRGPFSALHGKPGISPSGSLIVVVTRVTRQSGGRDSQKRSKRGMQVVEDAVTRWDASSVSAPVSGSHTLRWAVSWLEGWGRWSENGTISQREAGRRPPHGLRIQHDPIQCTLNSLCPMTDLMAARHCRFGSELREQAGLPGSST